MENSFYSKDNELHTINENLDADDESDSSEMEDNISNGGNLNKRCRKLSMQARVTNSNDANKARRRRTSCNDILPTINADKRSKSFNEASLPSIVIQRSMSLPEKLEQCDPGKKLTTGSKSAAGRLRLPGIMLPAQEQQETSHEVLVTKNSKNVRYLPNLGKCESPEFSLAFRNKSNSDKTDLDRFMRNHFR